MHPTCNENRQAYRQGVYNLLVNNCDVFKLWTLRILTWFVGGFLTVMCNDTHPQKCAQDEVMSQASHHSTDSKLLGRRQSTLITWLSVRMTNALPFYHGRCAADQTGNTSSVGLAGR